MEKIEIRCTDNSKCDFTGKNIKKKEPRVFLGGYEIKFSSTDKVIEILEMKSSPYNNSIYEDNMLIYKTEFKMHNLRKHTKHTTCDFCNKIKNEGFIIRREYSPQDCASCISCMNTIIQEMKNLDRIKDRVMMWSESGFCIRKVDKLEKTLFSKKSLRDEYIIELGVTSIINVRISNIGKLIEYLENEDNCKEKDKSSCFLCSNDTNDKICTKIYTRDSHKNINVHEKCRNSILEDIKKFERENQNFILSRKI